MNTKHLSLTLLFISLSVITFSQDRIDILNFTTRYGFPQTYEDTYRSCLKFM